MGRTGFGGAVEPVGRAVGLKQRAANRRTRSPG